MFKVALKTALVYASISLAWIALSDKVLVSFYEATVITTDMFYSLQSLKGYFFVSLTSILLFFLVKSQVNTIERVRDDFIRLFVENPNPMWIYDLNTYSIVAVNNAAIAIYGFSNEEFLKLSIFDLRPDSEHKKLRDNLVMTSNSEVNYDQSSVWLHKKKSGKTFYVNIFSHPTLFEGQKCRIVTSIDIDKEYRVELDLININRALKTSTHLCITDLDGTILEVNDIFAEKSGYTTDELVGNSIKMISSMHHSSDFWNNFWGVLERNQVWRGEMCNKAKDGSIYWYGTVVTPILNLEGKVYKYMSISSDITKNKELESEQLKRTEQLKEYAYLTSHDIRGPLTRLLALSDFYELSEENDIDFVVTNIKKTSIELDGIIRQMNEKVDTDLAI